ncbi:MAG: M16 family metallopeptidase [Longimicrobiales bacterium]
MRPAASRLLFPALLALLPSAVLGQGPAAAPSDTLPLDPAVRTGVLPNGMHYYIRENSRPEERAELRLVVNAGSVLETEEQRGLAHFVEHMAFNGTDRFEKQAIIDYLESIGMRFGADLNAYTSFDETVYMLTVPTDSGDFLQNGFRILADWAHAVTMDTTEVRKERGVVIEEWRLGQGSAERMREQIFPVLFAGSKYGERLPIGTRENLTSFDPAELTAFYDAWYRPDLMAVIAVGDFDADSVEALVHAELGGIPAAPGAADRPSHALTAPDTTRVVVARDVEATNTRVEVYWLRPARDDNRIGAFRENLVTSLYNAMLNARFSELAQTADPPFIGAASQTGSFVRAADAYVLAALVPDTGVVRGLEALLTEAVRVARHGFTETELERARANLLRGYELAYAEREKTNSATYANEYANHFLENVPAPGIAWEYEQVQSILPAITLGDVNAVAGEWLSQPGRTIVVQMPEKEGLEPPTAAELLAIEERVSAASIAGYSDDAVSEPLLPVLPEPGRVVTTRTLDGIDVTEWTLSNGIRVLVKPTDFRDDEILFVGVSPGGTSHAPTDALITASLATPAVQTMGFGSFSATQLQKALAGKAVGVAPGIGSTSEEIRGAASPADLETALQLVHLAFTAPRVDSTAFESLRDRMRAVLANQAASPQAAFGDTLAAVMTQNHPRNVRIDTTTIDAWSLEGSIDFYRERFADGDDFAFTFVGTIDTTTLRPLVERYIGSLPTLPGREQPVDHGVRPPDGVVEKVVRRGLEPQAMTRIIFTGPFVYDVRNRHLLRSLADVLEIRLRDELREERGGTYGVSVGAGYSRTPWENYSVTLGFGAAPDSLDALASAALAEIEKLQNEPPALESVQHVQEIQRRELEQGLRQNSYWLANLSGRLLTGEPPISPALQRELIDALTPEAIREAARQYLSMQRYVRVSLFPEN